MSADNGSSWTMIASSAPWHSRQGHSIAVSKDHIYMMGGFGGAQRFNDCWKTADGGTEVYTAGIATRAAAAAAAAAAGGGVIV
jgi:hypothetical protein